MLLLLLRWSVLKTGKLFGKIRNKLRCKETASTESCLLGLIVASRRTHVFRSSELTWKTNAHVGHSCSGSRRVQPRTGALRASPGLRLVGEGTCKHSLTSPVLQRVPPAAGSRAKPTGLKGTGRAENDDRWGNLRHAGAARSLVGYKWTPKPPQQPKASPRDTRGSLQLRGCAGDTFIHRPKPAAKE